jgi:hypothetical protein
MCLGLKRPFFMSCIMLPIVAIAVRIRLWKLSLDFSGGPFSARISKIISKPVKLVSVIRPQIRSLLASLILSLFLRILGIV